jgi:uncharacterized Zn finger protein (UPF0148 family)
MTATLACGVCERPINAPSGTTGTVLCPLCAAEPVLVAAFKEGRARLVEARRTEAGAER